MKKLTTLVAVATLAFAVAPPVMSQAFAQAKPGEVSAQNMRSSKLIGMTVYNDQGQNVGKVEDVVVKAGGLEPVLVLSVGDFVGGGAKLVGVPVSHVQVRADKVYMPTATKGHLTEMAPWQWSGLNGGGG